MKMRCSYPFFSERERDSIIERLNRMKTRYEIEYWSPFDEAGVIYCRS